MKVRFQADADLNQQIVHATKRREPSIDFQTASEANLSGLTDPEVLAIAARDGRILVTHDRKTMPGHVARFIENEISPGLFIISQDTPIIDVAEELLLIWAASETEEWLNRICSIPL